MWQATLEDPRRGLAQHPLVMRNPSARDERNQISHRGQDQQGAADLLERRPVDLLPGGELTGSWKGAVVAVHHHGARGSQANLSVETSWEDERADRRHGSNADSKMTP